VTYLVRSVWFICTRFGVCLSAALTGSTEIGQFKTQLCCGGSDGDGDGRPTTLYCERITAYGNGCSSDNV